MPEAQIFSTAPEAPPIVSTPAGPADPQLEAPPTRQLILGTDKRNPVFTVYEDDSGERLLVFYGFELLEIVKNDSEDPAFKLLLARLYNSGVKLSALCESFAVDPKTLRRWGQALRQGDPAELVRVLEGRSAGRKLTLAVENFSRLRWPDLVAQGSYGAVARLRREIQSVFAMKISRSTMSELIRGLKVGAPPVDSSLAQENTPSSSPESDEGRPAQELTEGPVGVETEKGETGVKSSGESGAEQLPHSTAHPSVQAIPAGPPLGNTAHPTPFFPKDPAAWLYWCDHAGVLIFATALAAVSKVSPTSQRILAQWMAALWLGAQNIEQTKFLNWEDLELILGGVVRFPTPQRDQLKALAADPGLLETLWRFNQKNLGETVGSDLLL